VTSSGYDLTTENDINLGGFVFKDGRPFLHNYGGPRYKNTALGRGALGRVTPGNPMSHSGEFNTAVGQYALASNTSGRLNVALRSYTLVYNETGCCNTAVGEAALSYVTGSENIGLGDGAGYYGELSDNIWIGNFGESSDSGVIKIGRQGTQGATYIAGISGVSPSGALQPVVIDSSGQLGTGVTGSGSLSFSSVSTCDVQTVTVTGAATGETVLLGPPSGFGSDLVATAWVSATNTVSVRVCAIGGSTLGTAANGTYKVAVVL
jgi:hypothetical protein